jgi:cytochrome c1
VPDRLVPWILDPRALDPDTAMPGLGLTEREARDAAAYLYTLD